MDKGLAEFIAGSRHCVSPTKARDFEIRIKMDKETQENFGPVGPLEPSFALRNRVRGIRSRVSLGNLRVTKPKPR